MGAGILDQDGNPWFIAADVYRILEITNTTEASIPTERENPP
jgi:prophage antirepressor-like protein